MNTLLPLLRTFTKFLEENHYIITTAESCTGGLVAGLLTELAGSSVWFDRGFVTYSNQSKQDLLDVPAQFIESFGAVSEEVAQAMALGALKNSQANCSLSITGIAGPGGGSAQKPVGMICFSWASLNKLSHQTTYQLPQSLSREEEIRAQACRIALEGAFVYLSATH